MAKKRKKNKARNPIAEGASLMVDPDRGSPAIQAGKKMVYQGMKEAGKGIKKGLGD